MSDSRTPGFLDASEAPAQELVENVLHDYIAGITSLNKTLVRPSYSLTPANTPAGLDTNWAAFSLDGFDPQGAGSSKQIQETDTEQGYTQQSQLYNFICRLSFFGKDGLTYALNMANGAKADQNRFYLKQHKIDLLNIGAITALPEGLFNGWRKRWDLPLNMNMEVLTRVNILTITNIAISYQSNK